MNEVIRVAQALADETRLNILTALLQGEATVNDLAARLGLSQPRISTHLALLREAGLVAVEQQGRQRTYRVDAKRVDKALAALEALTKGDDANVDNQDTLQVEQRRSSQAAREVKYDSTIRQARTCYDHLAGVAGVQLLDEMLKRGWLTKGSGGGRPTYQLTAAGSIALSERGVDLDAAAQARRAFAYGCLDWTERRSHLGGALGAAILAQMLAEGDIQPEAEGRAVRMIRPVGEWLDTPKSRLKTLKN
jgi:DNA-binding transcriptional ArsR family regulator